MTEEFESRDQRERGIDDSWRHNVMFAAAATIARKMMIVASHNCHKFWQLRAKQAEGRNFFSLSAAFCREIRVFVLADEIVFHHIVAARYCDP